MNEVAIPGPVWEENLRVMLRNPWQIAVGTAIRNAQPDRLQYLVPHLTTSAVLPQGAERPAFSDWFVLMVAGQDSETQSVRSWLAELQPQPGQTLILIQVGLGADRTRWHGWVATADQEIQVVDSFRIIGPGMLSVMKGDGAADSDAHDMVRGRWSRTIGALGQNTWAKVSEGRVAIIGTSRTGSACAFQLVALGCRRLWLIDPDKVEPHNLDSMVGLTEADIGQRKVTALARRLTRFQSDLAVSALDCGVMDARVLDAVSSADLLITCVDTDEPRLAVAHLANRLLKIHLDIGTGIMARGPLLPPQLAADIRLLVPSQGCVRCVGGLRNLASAESDLSHRQRSNQSAIRRPWQQDRNGSLVTLNHMAVSVAVQLWLDLLSGQLRSSHWIRIVWQPGRGPVVDQGPVTGAPDCPLCH